MVGQVFCLTRGHQHHEKKRYNKTKERGDSGKKGRKNSSLYCIPHGENKIHKSSNWKVIKARAAEKDKSKYGKKDYKKKFKELNLLQEEAAHQKSKYKKLNKAFTKSKTSKKETVNIADSSDSKSSYSRKKKT